MPSRVQLLNKNYSTFFRHVQVYELNYERQLKNLAQRQRRFQELHAKTSYVFDSTSRNVRHLPAALVELESISESTVRTRDCRLLLNDPYF